MELQCNLSTGYTDDFGENGRLDSDCSGGSVATVRLRWKFRKNVNAIIIIILYKGITIA